jgi:hypothetical protein
MNIPLETTVIDGDKKPPEGEGESKISAAIAKFTVNEDTALSLRNFFEPLERQAKEWAEKAKTLVVTDVSQTDLMDEAKSARLAIRRVRLDIAKKHSELKEDSLRKGQLLDLIKRTLTEFIEPTEAYLQSQEDFAYEQAQKQKADLHAKRIELIAPYRMANDRLDEIPFGEMVDSAFESLLTGLKVQKETREQELADMARIKEENERAAIAERNRMQEENERLRVFNNRVNQLTAMGFSWHETSTSYNHAGLELGIQKDKVIKMSPSEWEHELGRIRTKVNDYNVLVQKQKDAEKKKQANLEAKLKAERDERKRLEREEADRIEHEEIARKQKAADERKAKRAPDKDKLLALAGQIEAIEMPLLKDSDASEVLRNTQVLLGKVVTYINTQCGNL